MLTQRFKENLYLMRKRTAVAFSRLPYVGQNVNSTDSYNRVSLNHSFQSSPVWLPDVFRQVVMLF